MVSKANKKSGYTSLLDGKRVPKYHLRCETFGTLDELNSFLGMARAIIANKKIKETLLTIQNHLFLIGSELTIAGKGRTLLKGEISKGDVAWLDQLILKWRRSSGLNSKFIVYGETFTSSVLDVARAVSRRAERNVVKMESRKMLLNLTVLDYLNRLSGVLYFLARYEEKKAKVKRKHPTYYLPTRKR
jgi:cob(I)alamin adenosyltransferase